MVKKKPIVKKKKEEVVVSTTPNLPDPDTLQVPCVFVPKEDITAYELSVLLHFLLRNQLTFGDWKKLEKQHQGITRHLQPIGTGVDAASE